MTKYHPEGLKEGSRERRRVQGGGALRAIERYSEGFCHIIVIILARYVVFDMICDAIST